MNNKYLAVGLSIVAVLVVFYQIFLRKPDSNKNQQQINQPLSQPMSSAQSGHGGSKSNGESPGNPAASDINNDSGLIIDYNSDLLLKRIDPELVIPFAKREIPAQFGKEILVSRDIPGEMPGKSQVEREVEFRLNAIIIDDSRRIAIINDKILKMGDILEGAEVKLIAKSKVLLKIRGEEIVLSTNSRVKRVRLLEDRKE